MKKLPQNTEHGNKANESVQRKYTALSFPDRVHHALTSSRGQYICHRDIQVPIFLCSSHSPHHTSTLCTDSLIHALYVLEEDVVHESLDIAVDTRDIALVTANHTAIIAVLFLDALVDPAARLDRLLLDVALGEKDPAVPDAHGRRVDGRIDHRLLLVFARRMRRRERVALEVAVLALPDLMRIVHAIGPRLETQTALCLLAHCPRTLAEAPVIVILAGAARHHCIKACDWALDTSGADVQGAV